MENGLQIMTKMIIHTETTQEELERKMENQKPQPFNKDNCDKLKHDSTKTYKRLVNSTIERFKKQKWIKEKVSKNKNSQGSL